MKLRLIPSYTGDETLDEALGNSHAIKLLWLEILLNGEIPWEQHLDRTEVRHAYDKACVWYGRFKTMVEGYAGPRHLQAKNGEIDMREYQRFLEALYFVSGD